MPKPHTYHMKATVWTPTLRSDMSGTPHDCILSAFWALAGRPQTRAKLLDGLREQDVKMREREAAGTST